MCEMALDAGIQDMLRSSIAQWGSVLVQQVHQLFGDLSENKMYVVFLKT